MSNEQAQELLQVAKKRTVTNKNANRDAWIDRALKAEIRVHELEHDVAKQAAELNRLYAENHALNERVGQSPIERMLNAWR